MLTFLLLEQSMSCQLYYGVLLRSLSLCCVPCESRGLYKDLVVGRGPQASYDANPRATRQSLMFRPHVFAPLIIPIRYRRCDSQDVSSRPMERGGFDLHFLVAKLWKVQMTSLVIFR